MSPLLEPSGWQTLGYIAAYTVASIVGVLIVSALLLVTGAHVITKYPDPNDAPLPPKPDWGSR